MEILAFKTGYILITVLLALLLVAALFLIPRFRRIQAIYGLRRLKSGSVAEAIILFSEECQGAYLQGERYYKLQVHVKPARGRNFVTEINVLREDLKSIPQAGDKVSVRYNHIGRKRNVVLNTEA